MESTVTGKMEDPIQLRREEIEISGARKMYLYTFDLDGEPMPEMSEADIQQTFKLDPAKGATEGGG